MPRKYLTVNWAGEQFASKSEVSFTHLLICHQNSLNGDIIYAILMLFSILFLFIDLLSVYLVLCFMLWLFVWGLKILNIKSCVYDFLYSIIFFPYFVFGYSMTCFYASMFVDLLSETLNVEYWNYRKDFALFFNAFKSIKFDSSILFLNIF